MKDSPLVMTYEQNPGKETTSAGGASMVALGIAEALVGTAAGLVVAIPALLGYNYFVNKVRNLTVDWELVGGELIDFSLRNQK
jgi:biopolymer transport protein ExbB/TolQ